MATYAEQDEWAALRAYASDGDTRAFEVLVHRYQAMVYATCRRQLGNTTDAEDATQETFLKLARKAGSIRSSLSAWLHTCAVGTSRDLIRRHATRRKHEQAAAEAATPGKDAGWDELGPIVDEAMQSLSQKDRDLLVERFLMGVAQTQIAQREGVSPSAIHQRVDRAVKRLRRKLTGRGVPVAAVALGTLLTQAAEAAVPQAVTASAMKIGMAGLGTKTSGSVIGGAVQSLLGASVAAKLGAAAAATVLVAGSAVTVNQMRTPTPSPPAGNAPAVVASADEAADPMAGVWANRSWMQDGRPALGATIEGNRIEMFFPSSIPGTDRMQITFEVLETDPDAEPAKLVYKVIEANTPASPVTGEVAEASYRVDGSSMALAVTANGGPRPDTFEMVPGREVLTSYRSPIDGRQRRMDDGLDPALAGDWAGYVPMVMEVTDGLIVNRTTGGQILSELEVIRWDERSNPQRVEAVITTSSMMPELVGRTVRSIYEVRGDKLRHAEYDITSPKFGEWPPGFTGKKGDKLNLTTWQEVNTR